MVEPALDGTGLPGSHPARLADTIDAFLLKCRLSIAIACCCFAAVRVAVFAAGFPLFNPVDEPSHYEMVYEYSRGHLPGDDLLKSDPGMARLFTLYGTSEYYKPRSVLSQFHRDIPIAELPPDLKRHYYAEVFDFWHSQSNIETQSPPAYYAVAAVWYRLGELFGARDWRLAYWVRFLNAILYGAFVWVAFLFVRDLYPDSAFLCAAIPLLLAVFPQDVFFGVNRDVLSPLLAALFLLFLFRSLQTSSGGWRDLFLASLVAGLAFLTDVSNFVLLAVLLVGLFVKARRARQLHRPEREQSWIALSFLVSIALPVGWMARNRIVMGDLTGSQAKMFYLGWVPKPLAEIWHHPIFRWSGLWHFLSELTGSFWRGELVWAGGPLRNSYAELFYLYSTLLLIPIFILTLALRKEAHSVFQRWNAYVSLFWLLASIAFMGFISLLFDFQECVYPSRAWPYFISGRIIIGALLPFVVAYLIGFEALLRPMRKYVHPILPLILVCCGIVYAEITLAAAVFQSHFNFFALRRF